MSNNKIGKSISFGLSQKHMTQTDLANQMGIGRSLVNRWVKGEAIPAGDTMIKIVELLEIHEVLWPGIEKKIPPGENVTSGQLEEIIQKERNDRENSDLRIKEEIQNLVDTVDNKKKTRKIISIDDDRFVHILINEVLIAERFDYDLERTTDPGEAMNLIRSNLECLDLIILDLDFGVKDFTGVEILDIISRNRSLEEIPIMVFSAKENLVDKASKYKVRSFYKKPFDYGRFCRSLVDCGLVSKRRENRNINVLVVDDSHEDINYISLLLSEHKNISVSRADNAKDCIDIIERRCSGNNPIHLAIIDIVMPKQSGVDALDKINGSCEVFLISAHDTAIKKVPSSSKILGVYKKPITAKDIEKIIDMYCNKHGIL